LDRLNELNGAERRSDHRFAGENAVNTFFQHLRDPEYMHVLLNPLPVYGLAFGTLALALALFLP